MVNKSLLQTPEVLEEVTRELKSYFHMNDSPECNPGILWEAHKAVIRGVLVKHSSRIKKERKRLLNSLLDKIKVVESQHKRTPNSALELELFSLRKQYKVKAALQFCRNLVTFFHPYIIYQTRQLQDT